MSTPATLEPPLDERETRPSAGFVDDALILRMPGRGMTDRELEEFCAINGDLRIEQDADGTLIIMAPVGFEGSSRNLRLYSPFIRWWEQTQIGRLLESSAGFLLPDGSMLSPDVSWVSQDRIDAVPVAERRGFLPACPDFVVELRSDTDRLSKLQDKMAKYMANGARLGWLIDPLERRVHIYRPDQPVEVLTDPATVSGEAVLPGFVLELARVW